MVWLKGTSFKDKDKQHIFLLFIFPNGEFIALRLSLELQSKANQ